jgi:excisionase family DNA binding protein
MKKKVILHEAKDTAYLTVTEAARELGINVQTIRDHLVKGNLKTYKFKSLTLLSKEEVELWKEKQK